jgi:hypothetical protein
MKEVIMKRMVLFSVLLFCIVFVAHMVQGQEMKRQVVQDGHYFQYEGVLTDRSGEKLEGEYLMIFRVYDTMTSGSPLWEESRRVVVNDGAFKVVLGRKNPIPSTEEGPCYIGITIDGDDLSPRQPLPSRVGSDVVADISTPPVGVMDDPYMIGPPMVLPYGAGGDCWLCPDIGCNRNGKLAGGTGRWRREWWLGG